MKVRASVFVYFRLDGGVGGGAGGRSGGGGGGGRRGVGVWRVTMNENLLRVQRGGSDQCHPIVPPWQSGRIAVSPAAQWQARLS